MAVDIKIQTIGDKSAVAAIETITVAEQEQKRAFDEANQSFKQSREEMKKTTKEAFNMKAAFGQIKRAIVTAALFETFRQATLEIGKTTAQFQKLEATLTKALGSRSAARQALNDIRQFASDTPFQVGEIADSFNKLANRIKGIKFNNNQFTALGDLASATGKELDQLIEAILDINNTERWNELGIKVKTEGNRIIGTFKGVTKEFERSEEGALAMAQAFGELESVQGGMALVSETLGGQVSNLADNFESFKLNIGRALSNEFSAVIGFMNNLISLANGYLAVPLSEELKNEQAELNVLASALINTADEQGNLNTENTTTAGLIEEINAKYPDFLANLDQEALNIGTVRDRLEEVNAEYVRKILLQQQEEELTKIAEKQVKLQTKLRDLEKERANSIQNGNRVVTSGGGGRVLTDADRAAPFDEAIRRTEERLNKVNEEFAEAIKGQDALFERFGVTQEEATAKSDKATKAIARNTEATRSNNKAKDNSTLIAQTNLAIQRSELDFLLKKNLSAQANKENQYELGRLLSQEEALRQQLIEIKRQEAILNAKIDEQKQLANQNAVQENELLKAEIDLKRKAIQVEEIETIKLQQQISNKVEEVRDERLEGLKQSLKREAELREAANQAELEEEQRKQQQLQAIGQASFDVFMTFAELRYQTQLANIQRELEAIEAQKEYELKLVGDSERGKELTEQRYEERKRKAQEEQARLEQRQALFQIAIDSATNAVKLFGATVPPGILSALAVAQGIAQAAIVKKQSIPKFFDGIEWLPLGNNPKGKDTIPAMLHEGERVVPTAINQELKGISNKDLPKLVNLGLLAQNNTVNERQIAQMMSKAVENAIKKQPQILHQFDEKGFEMWVVNGTNKTKVLNQTFKL